MARFRRIASAIVLSSALTPLASAQTPPATSPPAPARNSQATAPASRTTRSALAPTQSAPRRRSIVHHYPYPYPNYYASDQRAGFRNPGGVGRYSEYYPPGDRFQNDGAVDPVRVATFDRGGGPTLADQRAAQQIGIQRENAIQQHIDNYARPYFGYGYGVGFFGGFN